MHERALGDLAEVYGAANIAGRFACLPMLGREER